MKKAIPQTLKGFRDFLPTEKRRRDFVAEKLKSVFERYGFEPLETPTLEYTELLMGKYGAEADKLIYNFTDNGGRSIGLRYDQTVPTARVLNQYQNDLSSSFRRYQFQNVFRAEKPQRGRYREFAQCDIDIFGSTSPIADAEILACTFDAYSAIGFTSVVLEFNDRAVLIKTLSPFTNPKVDVFSLIQSIDKLDKQEPQEVIRELIDKGLDATTAKAALIAIEKAEQSTILTEIEQIALELGVPARALKFNPKLARGLDYYTGLIFEVKIPEYGAGSVGGGGRYDNLLKELGGSSIPAVGMAVGFDRTVDAAATLSLLPKNLTTTQILVTLFDDSLIKPALDAVKKLRAAGVKTEVALSPDKLSKQLKMANQKQIPFVIIIGEQEATDKMVMLKDMTSGKQETLTLSQVIQQFK